MERRERGGKGGPIPIPIISIPIPIRIPHAPGGARRYSLAAGARPRVAQVRGGSAEPGAQGEQQRQRPARGRRGAGAQQLHGAGRCLSPPAPRGRLSGRPSARPPAAPRLTQIPPFSTPVPPLRGGSAPLRPRCRRSPPPLPGRGRPAPLARSPPRSPGPQPRGQRCLNPSKSLLSSLVRGGACKSETVAPLHPAPSIATAVRQFLNYPMQVQNMVTTRLKASSEILLLDK